MSASWPMPKWTRRATTAALVPSYVFAVHRGTQEEDMTIESSVGRMSEPLNRFAPLAGVLFAGLTIAGYFTIGEFPDGSTPAGELPGYYAAHGAGVSTGGTILSVAGVCFGIFGVAVWARLRGTRVPAVIAGLVLLGAAVDTMADLNSAAVYNLLGSIGVDPNVTAPALQAWHIYGSEVGVGGGMTLFLIGFAVAAIAYRAVPRTLAWTGIVLALAQFAPSPWGFYGSLAYLAWVAVAGIVLAVRPDRRVTARVPEPLAAG
jgi:hypothetical protein